MGKNDKIYMTITVDEDVQREFKLNCIKHKLKMSRVLNDSMELFNRMISEKEKED